MQLAAYELGNLKPDIQATLAIHQRGQHLLKLCDEGSADALLKMVKDENRSRVPTGTRARSISGVGAGSSVGGGDARGNELVLYQGDGDDRVESGHTARGGFGVGTITVRAPGRSTILSTSSTWWEQGWMGSALHHCRGFCTGLGVARESCDWSPSPHNWS